MSELAKLAICAIAKDEALYIEEWIAFHFLQGVSEILIFDNDSTDGMEEILGRIAGHVPVSVVKWPIQNYHEMQLEAYREGAARLARRADWVAFIDIDEFLFSSRKHSLPTELADFGLEVGAIAVGHRIFGSSGHTAYEPNFVTSRFVRCARSDHPQSQWFKTIARPALVETFDSAHSVVLRAGTYQLADHTALRRDNLEWHPGHADRVPRRHFLVSLYGKITGRISLEATPLSRQTTRASIHRSVFDEHNEIGSEMENDELRRFAEPIRTMISGWR